MTTQPNVGRKSEARSAFGVAYLASLFRPTNQRQRVIIGLGIPCLAIVPTIPILSRHGWQVFGLPAEVAWLFCCIPLTSACLALCWFGHDRHRDEG